MRLPWMNMGIKPTFVMAQLWEGEISERTISRALQKIGLTRKKKPMGIVNAPDAKRSEFLNQLGDPLIAPPGICRWVRYGWAGWLWVRMVGYGGTILLDSNPVAAKVALIWLQATLDGQLIAPFTVEGACNRSVFEIWLETCAMPVLQPGEWGKSG